MTQSTRSSIAGMRRTVMVLWLLTPGALHAQNQPAVPEPTEQPEQPEQPAQALDDLAGSGQSRAASDDAALQASPAKRSDPLFEAPVPPAPPAESHWRRADRVGGHWVEEHYGPSMFGVWAGSFAGAVLLLPVLPISILLVGVPPALLHFSHDNPVYGVLDIVGVLGAGVGGAFIGAQSCEPDAGLSCIGSVAGGLVLGMVAWAAVDIAFLTQTRVWRDGPTAQLSFVSTDAGAGVGLSGRF